MIRHKYVLEPEEGGGFSASVPELPGCFSQGDTADEAIRNLEAAAESWIEAAKEQNLPLASDALAAAVAAEREACAQITDKYRDFFRNERDGLPEALAAQFDVMAATLADVADAIRARGEVKG